MHCNFIAYNFAIGDQRKAHDNVIQQKLGCELREQ